MHPNCFTYSGFYLMHCLVFAFIFSWIILFIYLFTYLFICCIFLFCSSTFVSIFPSPLSLIPHTATSHPQFFPPSSLSMGTLYMFLDDPSPFFSCYPPPFCLLSVCSLFQCLWLHFACLFVLLIRFHLEVRSYGICLSTPGLFHLA